MHPVIQTAIATQHIRDMQAEAERTAQARVARARTAQARTAQARTARQGRSPRLGWLFDLADRRGAARVADDGPDFCCPEQLLTGHCAVHTGAHRVTAETSRRP